MKTKHLDNEIERLNLMERSGDLSKVGQDMLNEFKAIKQVLKTEKWKIVDDIEEIQIKVNKMNFTGSNEIELWTRELIADYIIKNFKSII